MRWWLLKAVKNYDIATFHSLRRYFKQLEPDDSILRLSDSNIPFVPYHWMLSSMEMLIPKTFIENPHITPCYQKANSNLIFSNQTPNLYFEAAFYPLPKEHVQRIYETRLQTAMAGHSIQPLDSLSTQDILLNSYRSVSVHGSYFYAMGLKEINNHCVLFHASCLNHTSGIWFGVFKKMINSLKQVKNHE